MPEEKESPWKPRFLSEYSMGELDFLRFNDHLKFVEMLSGEINSTDIPSLDMCQNYFAGLNVLFKLWKPIIASEGKITLLENSLKEAKNIKRNWEVARKNGMPFNDITKLKMVDILDAFHTELMNMKQIIGLGIKVQRNLTTKQRIKMGIEGVKGSQIMPEP